MNITMSILYEKLSVDYECRRHRRVLSEKPLQSLRLYSRTRCQREYLYVTESSKLRPQDLDEASVIVMGEPSFDYQKIPCDLILVDSVVDIRTLLNRVLSIYLSLLDWDKQMADIAREEIDLNVLLDAGRQELRYSFLYLNKAYCPTASSADLRQQGRAEPDGALMTCLLQCSGVEDISQDPAPRVFDHPETGLKGLYFNIYYKHDYRGKLVALCDSSHAITHADLALFETLCGHVAKLYERYSASTVRSSSYQLVQEALYAMFSRNGAQNRDLMLRALHTTGWGASDRYLVFYIPFGDNAGLSIQASFLITLVENRWNTLGQGSTRGVAMDFGVIWVVNLSRPEGVDYRTLIPEMAELLRRYNAKLGVSASSKDFFALPTYLKQAELAIRYGVGRKKQENIFIFKDYALDYMLESMLGDFSFWDVLHPALLILRQYDQENNTEFCKTLRVFLRCKYNVLQASNQLFIHRSTFSVRIKRIETLCGIDLDDERTRLHILLSFSILDSQGLAPSEPEQTLPESE